MNAPATPEAVSEFAREELTGKLLAVCVGQLEKLKTPWNMTTESGQEIAINAMEQAISNAVREAVKVIVTDRKPAIGATVESVTFKDGIRVVLSVSREATGRHDLADAEGGQVAIIIAPSSYTAGADKVEPAPDQGELPMATDPVPQEVEMKDGSKLWRLYTEDEIVMIGSPDFPTKEAALEWLTNFKAKAAAPVPCEIVGDLANGFVVKQGDATISPENFTFWAEADKWLTEHLSMKMVSDLPTPSLDGPGEPLPLPSIKPFEDGFMVYDAAGTLMFGGQKFPSQDLAESKLQKHLGVEKKKADKKKGKPE